MTTEERIIRLMAADSHTSESELDSLLADERIDVPQVDEEWSNFKTEHSIRREHRQVSSRWKIAAAITAICLLSGITIAAIHHAGKRLQQDETAVTTTEQTTNETAAKVQELAADTLPPAQTVGQPAPCTFEDTPLDAMLTQIAHHYNMSVEFQNKDARQLRLYYEWNPANSLSEVVSQLNTFRQFNIVVRDGQLIVE